MTERTAAKEPPVRPRARFDVADGAMLAVVLIWAGNNVVVKAVLDELAPLAYVVGRFVIVVVLVFGWLWARGVDVRVRRGDVPLLLLAGGTGYAAYNALFTIGLDRTSAFSVALLVALGPIFTLVFAALLGIEAVRPRQWLGVVVAVLGVAVFVGDKLREGTPAAGDGLNLLAAAAFAVYGLATRPLVGRYGAPVATAWSALVGLVAVLPFALPAAMEQDWRGLSAGAWGSLFYAAVLSMLVAYTLWVWAIARRGIGRTVAYLFLAPVVTGLLAALFLGEGFGPLKVGGALLVLVGLGLVRGSGLRGWGPRVGKRGWRPREERSVGAIASRPPDP